MSPQRVTRSTAKLAADSPPTSSSSTPPPQRPAPTISAQTAPGPPTQRNKRKLRSDDKTHNEQLHPPTRRSKRTKVDPAPSSAFSDPQPPAAMSSDPDLPDKSKQRRISTRSQDRSPDTEPPEPSRRRSSRKKSSSNAVPSTSTGKRSRRSHAKKDFDLSTKDLPTVEQSHVDASGDTKPVPGSGHASPSPHDSNPFADDDPFTNAVLSRAGLPLGLSSTLRAISGFMSDSSPQFKDILENLRAKDDPSVQMIALSELSEVLLVSNEDNLAGRFSPSQFVKELVPLMQGSDFDDQNQEVMLLACRCIANLIEALPSATAAVVYGGAVPVLCQKLLEISYIDLAEQALVTLEKISVDFPASIVRDGGLNACLSYLDFFATSTQRTAVTTAANCCRNIPSESFEVVRDVMPILLGVLASNDQKVVEQGSLCVCRIVESFKHQDSKLDDLVSPDLLKAILALLTPGTTNLIGPQIHTQFIRLLATVARSSPTLSRELLKMNVVDALYQILCGVSPPTDTDAVAGRIDKTTIMQALIRTPKNQIHETLDVIGELLPLVSSADLVVISGSEPDVSLDATVVGAISDEQASNEKRVQIMQDCGAEMERFAMILFPTLMYTYTSTVNLSVRQKTFIAQLRMLSSLDARVVEKALRDVPFASHIAAVLSQQDDPSLLILALQAAELLLKRLPDVYRHRFYREGVIAETNTLAQRPIKLSYRPAETEDMALPEPSGTDEMEEADDAQMEDEETVALGEGDEPEHDDDDDDDDDRSDSDTSNMHHNIDLATTAEDTIIRAAQRFMASYGTDNDSAVAKESKSIVDKLTYIASGLVDSYASADFNRGDELFRQLAKYFSSDALTGISSYELLISGIVDSLSKVFAGKNAEITRQARLAFANNFMSVEAGADGCSHFAVLVTKLQDLLSRTEHFEVLTVHHNASESNRSSAASVLSKQLRLKLSADEQSGIPLHYRNIVVSIHAIATFKALDEYLRPRISATMEVAGSNPDHSNQSPSKSPSFSRPQESTNPSAGVGQSDDHQVEDTEPSTLRRSLRRLSDRAQTTPTATDPNSLCKDNPSILECADETQLTDDEDVAPFDEAAAHETMDAMMEDLDAEDLASEEEEPSAVNVEVANTGKVTARKEDGTRISTPLQSQETPAFSRLSASARLSAARDYLSRHSSMSRALSYASALRSTPKDWHIEFSIDGKPVTNETTIYRAVHMSQSDVNAAPTRQMWSTLHTITFRKVAGPGPKTFADATSDSATNVAPSGVPVSLAQHPKTASILSLMSSLHDVNAHLEDIVVDVASLSSLQREPLSHFVNSKLTAKLNRQLEEPLIVASNCLPSWAEDLARQFQFVFPFESRHLFLQATSFGYSRSMARWQHEQSSNSSRRHRDTQTFMSRTQRQKVRISRSRILDSLTKVMEMYGSSPNILEVEYFDEVGTGLGPTLEFYSSVSREFARKELQMWRENEADDQSEFAFGKRGLFPAPMSVSDVETVQGLGILNRFKMLGKFVARSMLDSRIIDITFNPTFFRVAGERLGNGLTVGAVATVDQGLAASLEALAEAVEQKRFVDNDTSLTDSQKSEAHGQITVRGALIEDLAMDFTLPGYPSIELIENGAQTNVTLDNLGLYVNSVIEYTMASGVQKQIEAFKSGFSLVFPYTALRAFTSAELTMLFGQGEEDWSLEALMDAIKADHGFNLDSATIRNLLQVMSQYSASERRDFLQFVTGSPKLPIGGFKALTPMFTVVCKPSEPPLTSDDYLPSVMTCVNYLKLPNYSTMEILRAKLSVATKEGQGAFHLS